MRTRTCGVVRRQLSAYHDGELTIEEQVAAFPLDQESALAEPPDMQRPAVAPRCFDFGEEGLILPEGLFHRARIPAVSRCH